MANRDAGNTGRGAASTLGFDPNAVMVRDPGVLLDPTFLGALHSELEAELGGEEAAATLLQIGLLHGLQESARLVGETLALPSFAPGQPSAPPLAIRLIANPHAHPPGALELTGSWPERSEASGRLSVMGPCGHPSCWVSAGFTSGWLSGCFEADILALETSCSATGAADCAFVARDVEAWCSVGDPIAERLIASVPFDAMRELALRDAAAPLQEEPAPDAVDPDSAVVHIWGPVMVVPFAGPDEALRAIDLIGHDPAARDVSVVVLDLSDVILDEAFGAAALERIVDTIEAWGADSIFAAVSPLSEPVVEGLERAPLLLAKDVPQAIATAFQIAESQRRPV